MTAPWKKQFFAWLPVALWMAVIFAASTKAGSAEHTSRFLIPFLKWIYPAISENLTEIIQFTLRKTGHLTEYAILAMLMWHALRRISGAMREWKWKELPWIVLACAFYACTDEFHQSFVPTRYASPLDVLIDAIGAALGLLFLWTIGRLFKYW